MCRGGAAQLAATWCNDNVSFHPTSTICVCAYFVCVVQVTHAFPFPTAATNPDGQAVAVPEEGMDGQDYQMEMMKMLREVCGCAASCVGGGGGAVAGVYCQLLLFLVFDRQRL